MSRNRREGELRVVRDEVLDLRLDDRMPPGFEFEDRFGDELRARPAMPRRERGKAREDVELGEGARDLLQLRDVGAEFVEQRLEQGFLQRQRAVLGRQRLVLEGLELGRDVALGVLQRLPAPVVVGHLFGLRVGDLDVEAVHAVVLDLEVGDAGARALAHFELDEEFAGVRLELAQLVQLGRIAVGDHAAVHHARRRLRRDGAGEQRRTFHGARDRTRARRAMESPRAPARRVRAAARGCRAAPKGRAGRAFFSATREAMRSTSANRFSVRCRSAAASMSEPTASFLAARMFRSRNG